MRTRYAGIMGPVRWLIAAALGVGAALWSMAAFADTPVLATSPGGPGLVDVDGHQLYLDCRGVGSPVVIFDADLDEGAVSWELVQPAIAATTEACSYDRAGVGLSERGPDPRTSQQAVSELHTLLVNAGVPPPYILVGHGFGGLNSQLYAQVYPQDVVGMVLVDATHEEWYNQLRSTLPIWVRDLYIRQLASNSEGMNLVVSTLQVRVAAPRSPVPTTVITHGYGNVVLPGGSTRENEDLWTKLQQDLAQRLPSATLVVANQSGHAIARDQPDLVVRSIEQVRDEALARNDAQTRPGPWVLPLVLAIVGLAVGLSLYLGWQRARAPDEAEPRLLLGLRAGLRERQITRQAPR
jgi:pimeloyl-ACP methyl ester carboxylesterase